MAEYSSRISEPIQKHLRSILATAGLPDTEESFERLAQLWIEKEELFSSQVRSLDMHEVESLGQQDRRGALLLTYSGSLVSLGPLDQDRRWMEYASIKLRSDVPDLVVVEQTRLARDLAWQQEAEFTEGPLKSTSALYKIAVCDEDVGLEEQEKRIREATIFLTGAFVKLNRTLLVADEALPDQFTLKGMVTYLARKNGLSRKKTRQLLEDYLVLVETGMLLGSRVPLGKIGRLFLKLRPAQKARVVVNPATGEKITIPAKPETPVPKASFSSGLKEKAARVKLDS